MRDSLTHSSRLGLDISSVYINNGWLDSGNLVACGPTNLGRDSDIIILKIVVGLNATPQNRLYGEKPKLLLWVGISQARSGFDRPESGLRKNYKLDPSLWPIIGRFSWLDLAWPDLFKSLDWLESLLIDLLHIKVIK
ncbi:hypothetical protein MTR_8g022460 [Medicago truncatula]|uniref:Uncharacterized protein n=1 Tax=Medicago truncatula TaxID=3880 RepID=G7L8E4_MEDTR|nr:hypothetical protein MTR_8g022460 [Medicago truncatula]